MPGCRSSVAGIALTALFAISTIAVAQAPAPLVASTHERLAAPPDTRCTIKGTKGDDALRGTRKADVICAGRGADRIKSRGGVDVLRGGPGADLLRAADGDDVLVGGSGDDVLLGEDDADSLDGGLGADQLSGGEGDDECRYSELEDRLDTDCLSDFSIRNVAIAPTQIDTSQSAREVQVTVSLTRTRGSLGGLREIRVASESDARPGSPVMSFSTLDLPGSPLTLVAGTPNDGSWSGSMTLPRHSYRGEHRISLLLVTRGGSATEFDYDPIPYQGLARAHLAHTFMQVGQGDSGAPKVESLDFSPHRIDTSGAPASVRVRAQITDDLLGADQVSFYFRTPRPGDWSTGTSLELTSGTSMDGIWEGTVEFPQYSHHGLHRAFLRTRDSLHPGYYDASDLEALGFHATLEQAGPDDSQAPRLNSLSFQPRAGGVLVRAGVADDQSGPDYLLIDGQSTDGRRWYPESWRLIDPVSGTESDGIYEQWFDVEPGTWNVSSLHMEDRAHNHSYSGETDLQAAGFPTQFTVPDG